jgi:hypothetical protein
VRVAAVGDARQGRAGLALAAGAQEQDLVLGQVLGLVVVDEGLQPFQQADRGARRRPCGASSGRPGRPCGRQAWAARITVSMRATFEAKQATAILPVRPLDQLVTHRFADVGFRAGRAVDEDVGAVADHGQHALVAEAA